MRFSKGDVFNDESRRGVVRSTNGKAHVRGMERGDGGKCSPSRAVLRQGAQRVLSLDAHIRVEHRFVFKMRVYFMSEHMPITDKLVVLLAC